MHRVRTNRDGVSRGKQVTQIYLEEWSLFRCVCVCMCLCPGATPADADMYYGFTRFAVELNEIDELHRHLYAPTDTRFRPDQR